MKKVVLIVAGGTGRRMKSSMPKQFQILVNKPVLMHTIEIFSRFDPTMEIIVVLPENYTETWNKICVKNEFNIVHEIKTGGQSRFESVKNGIKGLPDNRLVAIHDGVRPLVSSKTINNCFVTALEYGNAVPFTDIPETLRKVTTHGNTQVNRLSHKLIQTPQVFNSTVLKKAYQQDYNEKFTDDASVVENLGYKIRLVEGNVENIKITHQHDLLYAKAVLQVNRGISPGKSMQ